MKIIGEPVLVYDLEHKQIWHKKAQIEESVPGYRVWIYSKDMKSMFVIIFDPGTQTWHGIEDDEEFIGEEEWIREIAEQIWYQIVENQTTQYSKANKTNSDLKSLTKLVRSGKWTFEISPDCVYYLGKDNSYDT